MAKLHVKKGDNVVVIAGKDKGKVGKVLVASPSDNTVVVEGVNFIVKHKKPRSVEDKGGIIKKEGAFSASNVQLLDSSAKKATRVYNKVVDGKKVRISKSGNVLDTVFVKKSAKKADAKVAETAVKPVEKAESVAEKVEKAPKTRKSVKAEQHTAIRQKTTTSRARNQER